MPIGVTHETGELTLEYQTAKLLRNIMGRASDYATLGEDLQKTKNSLLDLAQTVSDHILQG